MKASNLLLDKIQEFEGCRLASYRCPAGVWTIGVGHTRGVRPGQTITPSQAITLLEGDLRPLETTLTSLGIPLTQGRCDALPDFCLNLSPPRQHPPAQNPRQPRRPHHPQRIHALDPRRRTPTARPRPPPPLGGRPILQRGMICRPPHSAHQQNDLHPTRISPASHENFSRIRLHSSERSAMFAALNLFLRCRTLPASIPQAFFMSALLLNHLDIGIRVPPCGTVMDPQA